MKTLGTHNMGSTDFPKIISSSVRGEVREAILTFYEIGTIGGVSSSGRYFIRMLSCAKTEKLAKTADFLKGISSTSTNRQRYSYNRRTLVFPWRENFRGFFYGPKICDTFSVARVSVSIFYI